MSFKTWLSLELGGLERNLKKQLFDTWKHWPAWSTHPQNPVNMIWHLNATLNYMGMGHTQKEKYSGQIVISWLIMLSLYTMRLILKLFLFAELWTQMGMLLAPTLLYIYICRQLFQIFTQSVDAIDVTSVTKSRLNSINAIHVTRCKLMLIECWMLNAPMFQCSNLPMFQCFNVPIFQCFIGPLVHWFIGPLVHWSIGPLVHWSNCQ